MSLFLILAASAGVMAPVQQHYDEALQCIAEIGRAYGVMPESDPHKQVLGLVMNQYFGIAKFEYIRLGKDEATFKADLAGRYSMITREMQSPDPAAAAAAKLKYEKHGTECAQFFADEK